MRAFKLRSVPDADARLCSPARGRDRDVRARALLGAHGRGDARGRGRRRGLGPERCFDRAVAAALARGCGAEAVVAEATEGTRAQPPPLPFNTVELLKTASKVLRLSPAQTMRHAEHPTSTATSRTRARRRTSSRRPSTSRAPCASRRATTAGAPTRGGLDDGAWSRPRRGTDAGDHPPITPTAPFDGGGPAGPALRARGAAPPRGRVAGRAAAGPARRAPRGSGPRARLHVFARGPPRAGLPRGAPDAPRRRERGLQPRRAAAGGGRRGPANSPRRRPTPCRASGRRGRPTASRRPSASRSWRSTASARTRRSRRTSRTSASATTSRSTRPAPRRPTVLGLALARGFGVVDAALVQPPCARRSRSCLATSWRAATRRGAASSRTRFKCSRQNLPTSPTTSPASRSSSTPSSTSGPRATRPSGPSPATGRRRSTCSSGAGASSRRRRRSCSCPRPASSRASTGRAAPPAGRGRSVNALRDGPGAHDRTDVAYPLCARCFDVVTGGGAGVDGALAALHAAAEEEWGAAPPSLCLECPMPDGHPALGAFLVARDARDILGSAARGVAVLEPGRAGQKTRRIVSTRPPIFVGTFHASVASVVIAGDRLRLTFAKGESPLDQGAGAARGRPPTPSESAPRGEADDARAARRARPRPRRRHVAAAGVEARGGAVVAKGSRDGRRFCCCSTL